jgi:hypothetical protein
MKCRRLDIITIIVIAAICYTYTRIKKKKICFCSRAHLSAETEKKDHEKKRYGAREYGIFHLR